VGGKSLSGGSRPLLVRTQGSDRSLPAGPSYVIGRDPECDIAIADIRVSWHHAVLRLENGRWVLADNGSTNGTYAAGQRVERIQIDAECQVRLGNPADGPVLRCTVSGDGPPPEPDGEPGEAQPRSATTVRIGRAPENDIVVSDPTASRQHAELRNVAGECRIVDLDSSHGTFVNGQRVTDAALADGDTVRVGSALFRLIGQELQEVTDTDAEAGQAPPPVTGEAPPPAADEAPPVTAAPRISHRASLATWFGPGFYGQRTACGQVLTPAVVGVAHRSLPCGTLVKVSYRGRQLIVPVIDRGPYAHNGAAWDLTSGAAQALGVVDTVRVATRVVGIAPNTPALGLPPGSPPVAIAGGAVAL